MVGLAAIKRALASISPVVLSRRLMTHTSVGEFSEQTMSYPEALERLQFQGPGAHILLQPKLADGTHQM